jgi:hypothetical protein
MKKFFDTKVLNVLLEDIEPPRGVEERVERSLVGGAGVPRDLRVIMEKEGDTSFG